MYVYMQVLDKYQLASPFIFPLKPHILTPTLSLLSLSQMSCLSSKFRVKGIGKYMVKHKWK